VIIAKNAEIEDMSSVIDTLDLKKKVTTVIRSCNTYDVNMLNRASIDKARSVIILADENDREKSDITVFETILLVMHAGFKKRIIVELFDDKYEKAVNEATKGNGLSFVASQILATVVLQCMVAHRLTSVYEEIMSLRGSEFYIKEFQDLEGRPFRDIVYLFDKSIVCGWQTDGKTTLLPELDEQLPEQAQLVFIAPNVDAICASENPFYHAGQIKQYESKERHQPAYNILIINMMSTMELVMEHLCAFAGPGTILTFIANYKDDEIEKVKKLIESKLPENFTYALKSIDLLDPEDIDSAINLHDKPLDKIIMFPQLQDPDSDKNALMTAFLLQSSLIKNNNTTCEIIVEVLQDETKKLIQTFSRNFGFVVEYNVVGCWLAESALYCDNYGIIMEIFSPGGCDIYYKPLHRYHKDVNAPVTFWEIQTTALSHGEIAIGWHELHKSPVLNPVDKSKPIPLEQGTQIIVLARDNSLS